MKFRAIFLVICVSLMSACSKQGTIKEEKLENVVRVYYHEQGNYSFAVLKEGTSQVEMKNYTSSPCIGREEVKIFRDVPSDQKMWVLVGMRRGSTRCYDGADYLEIHIHSIEED